MSANKTGRTCKACKHGLPASNRHSANGCGFCRNQAGGPGPCAKPAASKPVAVAAKPAPAKSKVAKTAPAKQTVPAPKTTKAAPKPSGPCGCGCGATCKPGRRFVQGHDARKLPWFVAQAAAAHLADAAEAAKVARAAKRAGPVLGVLADQAADSIRQRENDGTDWANIPADSLTFRREVAAMVASVLYETSS